MRCTPWGTHESSQSSTKRMGHPKTCLSTCIIRGGRYSTRHPTTGTMRRHSAEQHVKSWRQNLPLLLEQLFSPTLRRYPVLSRNSRLKTCLKHGGSCVDPLLVSPVLPSRLNPPHQAATFRLHGRVGYSGTVPTADLTRLDTRCRYRPAHISFCVWYRKLRFPSSPTFRPCKSLGRFWNPWRLFGHGDGILLGTELDQSYSQRLAKTLTPPGRQRSCLEAVRCGASIFTTLTLKS